MYVCMYTIGLSAGKVVAFCVQLCLCCVKAQLQSYIPLIWGNVVSCAMFIIPLHPRVCVCVCVCVCVSVYVCTYVHVFVMCTYVHTYVGD